MLPNKDQLDIIHLLGYPDTSYFKEADLVYRLGMERGIMSIDSEWLLIYLDENKIFKSHKIKTD